MKNYTKTKILSVLAIASIMILTSCSDEVENRGYVTKFSDFSQLKVGKTTQPQAAKLLGSPTTISTIDGEKWIYLGIEETKETFYEPEIKTYDAYILSFNSSGILSGLSKKDKNNLNELEIDEDYTKTGGNEVTFMQQLLGNLGKFNPASSRARR